MSLDKALVKDLSNQAVKKEVMQKILQSPATIYTAGIALLSGFYCLLIAFDLIALIIFLASASSSAMAFFGQVIYKREAYANTIVSNYRKKLEAARLQAMQSLGDELEQLNNSQGLKQIELFSQKFNTFVSVLNKKLSPEELTYNRYLSIAEQVFLGGLDHLENAAISLRSVSAIDIEYIQQKIAELEQDSQSDKVQLNELKNRLQLKAEQELRVKKLMSDNERALTQLDTVTTKIAVINTKQGQAQLDFEEAMTELKYLIERTDNYSN